MGNYTTKENQYAARVKTNVISNPDTPIEALSIMFKEVDGDAHLMVGWENTVVELPIKM